MCARESLPKAGNALQEVCVCVSVRVCVWEQVVSLVVQYFQNSFFLFLPRLLLWLLWLLLTFCLRFAYVDVRTT